jgi:putative oxidoreductase
VNYNWQRYVELAGRILLCSLFLMSSFSKITNWSGTEAAMASKGLPMVEVLLPIAVLFELGGALSVLLGYYARLGALALFLFLIPTTLTFHNFWAVQGPDQLNQIMHFMKNVVIMGGLLKVIADGAGAFSIDARRGKLVEATVQARPTIRRAA